MPNVSHTTSLTQHHSQAQRLVAGTALSACTQHLASSHNVWRRLGTGLYRGRRSTLLLAKGSDVRPGVVWRRLASAGHRRRFRGRHSSTLLLAKGSDVRPGVVWRRLGTGADFVAGAALCCLPRGRMYALASSGVVWRRLGTGADFVAGAALCCLPRGRMYALASSGVGWAPAQISWQAQHFAACQGVGCTPWRRLASAGHRRRFRGRRSTLLLAKGSDVRPGVVWRRLGTGADFVAGAALCCLPRGRMYALASSGVGWAPAQISWQAQHFAACQGVGRGLDVRPGVVWRRLGTGADFVAGAVLCCLPRGRMYALASSGVVWAPAQISWQAQHFAACQGVGCTPWRPGVVWRRLGTGADFVAGAALCCLPRGRMYALASSGVGWAPAQISWQAQHFATLLLAKGSDVRPGVVWRRLGTGADFVAGAALCCFAKGSDVRPGVVWSSASAGHRTQISWQAQHFAACQGVGCTPWRRLASAGHRRRFRGRRSTLLLAKGSDVRPGVVWRRLGTGADFVAGAALCCLPRGRMYTPWRRLASSGVGMGTGADFVAGTALCCFQGVGCTWRRLASRLGTGADFVAGAALCCLPRGRMYALASSGVVWRRLGTGADFVAGAALCCLPRGRMYALASSGVGWAPAQISWQAQHFAAGQL